MAFQKSIKIGNFLIVAIFLSIILIFSLGILKEGGHRLLKVENQDINKPLDIAEIKPINVLFVGDIMLDRKVELEMEKNGFDYPFAKIRDFLNKSDFVFANLEGPISESPLKFSLTAMNFAFSDKVVEPLFSSNFRILSLANNHTLNMYQRGLEETKTILSRAGIDWVGDPIACSNDYVEREGLIFLAFNTTFSECKGETIAGMVKKIKEENPDKFLIVSMHWGEEYKINASQQQKDLGHKIIDAGADLIIGHHPHVIQEYENYKGKMIFYSLGNFIFDQYFSEQTQQGLAVRLEIYGTRILYRIIPIKSIISQPQPMEKEEAESFLEKRNFESVIAVKDAKVGRVCFGDNCFYAEIVEKPKDLMLGLMFRKYLDEDRAMLFIFPEYSNHAFWMKNTLIPLDIIWLNENKEVVYIGENIQPCSDEACKAINPIEKSGYVLEVNAGLAQKINLKIGDKLVINNY